MTTVQQTTTMIKIGFFEETYWDKFEKNASKWFFTCGTCVKIKIKRKVYNLVLIINEDINCDWKW